MADSGFYLNSREVAPGVLVYQRAGSKTPVWQYRLTKPDGSGYVAKSAKTVSLKEASRLACLEMEKIKNRYVKGQELTVPSFGRVADDFLDSIAAMKKKNPRKYESYEAPIRLYFKVNLGKEAIDTIDRYRLRQYYSWRGKVNNKEPSASTLNSENVPLRAIFDFAVECRIISESELPRIRNFSLEEQEPRVGFSENDYRKLRKAAYRRFRESKNLAFERYRKRVGLRENVILLKKNVWQSDREAWQRFQLYIYVLIMANTGMRPETARKIMWKDVIPNPLDPGKGVVIWAGTKKGRKARKNYVVPFSEGQRALRMLHSERPDKSKKDVPLFDFSSFKRSFATTCESANVLYDEDGRKRTIYSLRHYYITKMLYLKVPITYIANNTMTSIGMIDRHYNHTSTLEMFDELAQNDARFGSYKEALMQADDL